METDDYIPLSALQHYSYCPRQCALIHQEQTFAENLFTVRGRIEHERVDQPGERLEDGVRAQMAVPLVCERLGLVGRADAVEILPDGTLRPVEYKHGPRRQKEHDDLQVAGQALCLEEMTGKTVAEGAVFHHGSRRRRVVPITPELRARLEEVTAQIRAMLDSGRMPPPAADAALCRGCSLLEACQPELLKAARDARRLAQTLFEPEAD